VKRVFVFALAVSAVVGAGCADDGSNGGGGDGGDSESARPCAEVFAVGLSPSADDLAADCALADGSTARGELRECVNGEQLVSFSASDPDLWGFLDEPLREAAGGDLDSDPEYAEISPTC